MDSKRVLWLACFCIFAAGIGGGFVSGATLLLYDFQDGSGTTALDLSGNNNHGVLAGFANTSAGAGLFGTSEGWVAGGGLSFLADAVRSYVSTPLSLGALTGDFTAEFVASYTGTTSWAPVFGSDVSSFQAAQTFFFGVNSNQTNVEVRVQNSAGALGVHPWSIPDATSHHVVMTYRKSDNQVQVFINGVLAATGTRAATMNTATSKFRIGNTGWAPAEQWGGVIYGVAISNERLEPGEFVLNYKARQPNPADGAGQVAPDSILSWQPPNTLLFPTPTYKVYMGTTPAVSLAGTTDEASYNPGGLARGTTYYWRVDVDGGATGDLWTFTTEGIATHPSPGHEDWGQSPLVTLKWTGDESIASYDVWMSSAGDPNSGGYDPNAVSFVANVTGTSYTPAAALTDGAAYSWRIVTRDSGGSVIATGPVWRFDVGRLVAHYAFDGNLSDASGEGRHGTALGGVSFAPGLSGQAAVFNGLNNGVSIGNWNPATTGKLTLSCLAKWNGLNGGWQGIIGKREAWSAAGMMFQWQAHNTNGAVRFATFSDGGNAAPMRALIPGHWEHLAVSFDGTHAWVYLDGELKGTYPFRFDGGAEAGMTVGATFAAAGAGSEVFNGLLDDVRIWDGIRLDEEIETLYWATPIAKRPDPVHRAIDMPLDWVLSWTTGGGPVTGQTLYLNDDPNMAGAVLETVSLGASQTSYAPTAVLNLAQTYYWRVDTVTATGTIEGNVWSFTTAPPRPYDPIPADGQTDLLPHEVVLSWLAAPVGGPYTHTVYLSKSNSSFSDPDDRMFALEPGATSLQPSGLNWSSSYWWQVKGDDGANQVESEVWRFTTITPQCNSPLSADVNGDCMVDLADLAEIAGQWLQCNLVPQSACP
ncbi:MAG: hypothetical protein IH624_03845 [Phycisphaerae bacterium]|nr:hypothetical protein [Phycisphaerae bacterium]